MAAIKSKRTIEVVTGLICDKCGAEEDRAGGFVVDYTFGYGTTLDMTTVSFALCDSCLAQLVINQIPNAVFTQNGKQVTVEHAHQGFITRKKK